MTLLPLQVPVDAAATSAPFWWSIVPWALLAFASTVLAVWIVWRRALADRPQEWAFRSLSRASRLSRGQVQLLRLLAEHAGLPAVCLLLSPHVLRRSFASFAADQPAHASLGSLEALVASLDPPSA